ncbi:MAG: hypothetical protein EA397_10410 [Deltaproteobacteria bacterium]|nr:MAG: hypothetical protein EA397_10410 [Deltaproteobacteria bacterium]
MRRSASVLSPSLLLILAASTASASEPPELRAAPTTPEIGSNTIADPGVRLDRVDVVDASGTWYRAPFTDLSWELQLEHDDATWFAGTDSCLPLEQNPALSSPDLLDVHGVSMRVGPHHLQSTAAALPSGTELPVPGTVSFVDGAHLLVRGSDLGTRVLELTWTYADGTTELIPVEVLSSDIADRAREATDGSWAAWGYDGLRSTSCGEGADLLWISNPNPEAQVVSLQIQTEAGLAGPLALSLASDRISVEDTFEFQGSWDPETSLDAGQNALWYQVSWREELNDGAIELFITCSDDDLHWQPETGPLSSFLGDDPSGTYLPTVCDGRFVRYRVVLTASFNESPVLEDVTFYYDLDEDGDGFGRYGLAGPRDCDDSNPDIFPGAPDICGDGIDSNCDGIGGPDGDEDGDGLTWRQEQALGTSDCEPNINVADRWTLRSETFDNPNGSFGLTQHWYVGPGGLGMVQSQANAGHHHAIRLIDYTPGGANQADRSSQSEQGTELGGFSFSSYDGCPEVAGSLDISQDSDGDGIPDVFEMDLELASGTLFCDPRDSDGDGVQDVFDVDDDNDSVLSAIEILEPGPGDFSTWMPFDFVAEVENISTNFGDPEAMISAIEAVRSMAPNANGNSQPNWLDLDDDGDGVPTLIEANDTNANGQANVSPTNTYTDDGRDKAWTVKFGFGPAPTPDLDSDGIPNHLDIDDDGDGILTATERVGSASIDTDEDGTPDYLDTDSDGDGVPDWIEGHDVTGDGLPDNEAASKDDNRNGLDDAYDPAMGGVAAVLPNSNSNGLPDYRDDDDDGDGVPTRFERGAGYIAGDAGTYRNTNGGSLVDYRDDDDDGDGVPTLFELGDDSVGLEGATSAAAFEAYAQDTDEDGTPDFLDDDDDGDGVPTAFELGDNLGDLAKAQTPEEFWQAARDTDDDGVPNFVDEDDDGDTIPTLLEIGDDPALDAATDAASFEAAARTYKDNTVPDFLNDDEDNDGVPTRWELHGSHEDLYSALDYDTFKSLAKDTDEDGTPDFLDEDDDGDLVKTIHEIGPSPDYSANSYASFTASLQNTDGPTEDVFGIPRIPDFLDNDDDGDSLLTSYELGDTWDYEDQKTAKDSDNDGIPDYLDPDDDGDGVPTLFEVNGDPTNPTDGSEVDSALVDPEGTLQYLSGDDDGDGILTKYELPGPVPTHFTNRGQLIDWARAGLDSDGDNFPDFIDPDDDGDSVPTRLEFESTPPTDVADRAAFIAWATSDLDSDSDGVPDFLDDDDDGDTIPTRVEISSTSPASFSSRSAFLNAEVNTDKDEELATGSLLRPDFIDPDDDGDGILTRFELPGELPKLSNRAALIDWAKSSGGDFDGDGNPDFLDFDDDDDGVPTRFELGNTYSQSSDTGARRTTSGVRDHLNPDDDDDGVPTRFEIGGYSYSAGDPLVAFVMAIPDTDSNELPDYRDNDDDGDTIPTYLEIGDEYDPSDNSGVLLTAAGEPQYLDDDEDNDGVPTRWELGDKANLSAADRESFLSSLRDTDNDDVVDYLDEDDDGDDVKTVHEIGSPNYAATTLIDFFNSLQNTDKAAETARGMTGLNRMPDYLDNDDDGDSLLTSAELGPEWVYADQATARDTNENGTPDYLDPDDDGDGIPTLIEVDGDPDDPTDGSDAPKAAGDDPNYLSEDDDGDGILTRYELGFDLANYTFTTLEQLNSDARNTDVAIESRFGKDPTPDYLDPDDDGDSIPTRLEADGVSDPADAPISFGETPDYLSVDDDGDGVPTRFEILGPVPESFSSRAELIDWALNTTLEGDPDFLNPDDDGDGVLTIHELGDANSSVTDREAFVASAQNTDSATEELFSLDALPDYLDSDDDGDTIPTRLETGGANNPANAVRTSGDTPDYLNDDDDGDGVPTRFELGEDVPLTLTNRGDLVSWATDKLDTDGDGVPNFLDDDDDGDSVPTRFEIDAYTNPSAAGRAAFEAGAPNSDEDYPSAPGYSEAPDYLDHDDDGDGVRTRFELGSSAALASAETRADFLAAARNSDNLDLPDFLDVDDDDDGIYTWFELSEDYDADTNSPVLDTDGDGVPNYRDNDDDGDTIPTRLELGDSYNKETGEGAINSDAFFTFSDDIPDYLDDDDDNDLVPTRFEVVGADFGAADRSAFLASVPNTGPDAANYINPDDDGDSVLTRYELGPNPDFGATDLATFRASLQNTDVKWEDEGAEVPDYLDDDDDGDNIPTIDEEPDPNGDGNPEDARVTTPPIPDYLNPDDDGDGVYTKFEIGRDTDGDGIVDHLDPDDDGDGILTRNELGSSYEAETNENARNTDAATEPTFGKDPLVDFLDPDDDGDTVLTKHELGEGFDPEANGPFLDTDKDGVPDHLDLDDDGDRVWTRYEVGSSYNAEAHTDLRDTDEDGIANYLDNDDDGDHVLTTFELGSEYNEVKGENAQDTDGDTTVDYLDPDDDGDTVLTMHELGSAYDQQTHVGARDTDKNTVPDYLDRDDDGDTVLTRFEVGDSYVPLDHTNLLDTDLDTVPNYLDPDDDGDTVLTANELHPSYNPETHSPLLDTDEDNQPNHVDRDDDGDGILTRFEVGQAYSPTVHGPLRDTDGDTFPDYLDSDDDNDGVPTFYERGGNYDMETHANLLNTIPSTPVDYRNPDDDNDNVPTMDELGEAYDPSTHTGWLDTDKDTVPNYIDVDDDGDGFLTRDEAYDERGRRVPGGNPQLSDFDGDGTPDYLDSDDDDDGVATICEFNLAASLGIGYLDRFNHRNTDTDDDGISDLQEWDYLAFINEEEYDCENPQDWDEDGTPDVFDVDDDGDGILTIVEGDRDDDQVPPVDGHCSEVDWGGATCTDPSKDDAGNWIDHPDVFDERPDLGIVLPNYLDLDSDGDTRPDIVEGVGDDDNDGIPNYRDCDDCDGCDGDSDGDGIPNCVERDVLQSDPRSADTDGDGVRDTYEARRVTAVIWEPIDTDGDGVFDINDVDDDGDGVLTRYELTEDGTPLPEGNPEFAKDTDDDTIPDYLDDDDDGDLIPTAIELGPDYVTTDPACGPADHLCRLAQDSDCDGIPDFLDFEDQDGPCGDMDGDGLENSFEVDIGSDPFSTDSDGDGVPDDLEVDFSTDPPTLIDTDGDGVPDILDEDDDGDGILTRTEGAFDVDQDGVPNYLDLDSNGDGIPDSEYGEFEDTDGDGIPDYLDLNDMTDFGIDCNDPAEWNSYDCPPREEEAPCACSSGANTPQGFGLAGLFFAGLMMLRRRRRS